jgi:acyl-CoA reductase-like NAD-dependent aldehyde dehydrogenase
MSTPNFPNFIDGEWVDSPNHIENRNPADPDKIVGLFSKGSAADVDRAADAAQAAFAGWASMPAPARGAILYKAADILDKKFDQLGAEMTREEGKTLPEAKGEVRRAINIFRYFAGEGSRFAGHLVPSERVRLPEADRRSGPDYTVEFSHCDSGLEAGPRTHLRQHGHHETRQRRPPFFVAFNRSVT